MGRELDNIDLTVTQRKEVAILLKHYLPNTEVWAYGSRVKFTSKLSSDLDVVVFIVPEQKAAFYSLKEAFEESSLPFRVDLFIWDEVPEQFHKNIKEERFVLQKKIKDMGNDWRELPFTEAVQINPKVILKRGHLYPFVDMKAVDSLWRSVAESEHRIFTGGGVGFRPYDTLMARITPCLENGKIARYVPSNNSEDSAFCSTEFIVIRGKVGITDNNFAYYLTKWQEICQFAISQMTGSSGRQSVPVESLSGFCVPVPDLPEQRAIAHILGSLDDKIELNCEMNETLEAMAQALFKGWFVDFDPVIDNALDAGKTIPEELLERATKRSSLGDARKLLPADIRKLFPDEFVQSELGWIPKGWEVKTLKECSNISTGKHPPLKEKVYSSATPIPIIGAGGIMTYTNQYLLDEPIITTGRVGTHGIIKRYEDRNWVSDNSFIIRSNIFQFAYPTIEISEHFENMVQSLYCHQHLLEEEIITLIQVRDTLLPKLISGEIRIPEAETLIEASV